MSNVVEIYTIGGGEILEFVFNGIAMFFTGAKSIASRLMQVALIFGGFWVTTSMVLKNNLFIGPKWFVFYLVLSELLFAKTVTVQITDTTNNMVARPVSNVPLGLAYAASLSSRFGVELTKSFEKNFSVVDDVQYTKTGMVFGAKLVGDMLKLTITDARFQHNLNHYIDRCITNIATIGYKYDWPKLKEQSDIWKFVTQDNTPSPLWKFIYRDSSGRSKILPCEEGAPLLTNEWATAYEKFDKIYSSKNLVDAIKDAIGGQNNDATQALSQQVKGILASNFDYLSNMRQMAGDSDKLLRQALMLNSIVDTTQSKTQNYAATKALMQQKTHYQTVGYLAQEALPVFKVIIEGLVYGCFVIVIFFALLPGGWATIMTYMQIVVWLQLWAPLFALLHGIMMKVAQYKTASLVSAYGGYTMMNALGIVNFNSNVYATAGYISMSVPYLAYMLLKGGVSSFVQMATNLGSGYQSAAASAAGEVTSGNFSQGNVQYGNTSAMTMSAFQQSASPHMNKGHFSRVMNDGSIQTITADGRSVYQAGVGRTISSFKTHMELGSSIQNQLHKSIAAEESFLKTQQKSLTDAQNVSLRDAKTFGDVMTQGISKGQQYSINSSSGEVMSIQNLVGINKDLQDRTADNQSQGVQVNAGGNVGFSIGGSGSWGKQTNDKLSEQTSKTSGKSFNIGANAGVSAGGSYSSNASRNQTASQNNDLTDSEKVSNNLDYMYRVAKNTNFGEHQSVEAKAAKDFIASYEQMQSLSDTVSKTQQSLDRYTQARNKLETSGITTTENLDQEFFEYVKEQKGEYQATRLLGLGGDFIKPYKDAFEEKKFGQFLREFDQDIALGSKEVVNKYAKHEIGKLDTSQIHALEAKFKDMKTTQPIVNKLQRQSIDQKIQEAKAKTQDKKAYYENEREIRRTKFQEGYKKLLPYKAVKNIGKK